MLICCSFTNVLNSCIHNFAAISDRSSPGSPMFHIDDRESVKYKSSANSDHYIYMPKMLVSYVCQMLKSIRSYCISPALYFISLAETNEAHEVSSGGEM